MSAGSNVATPAPRRAVDGAADGAADAPTISRADEPAALASFPFVFVLPRQASP